MQLTLQSENFGNVQLIRCQGRLVVGEEVQYLQREVERYTLETKQFVLQIAGLKFVDSGGLGALVRIAGTLRSHRGDLKLCQASPFVLQMLETTALSKVFRTYASEQQAINAFSERHESPATLTLGLGESVLCVDPSLDLLAYLNALLKRSGYQAHTTNSVASARMLVQATKPAAIVCGPGLLANEFALASLKEFAPKARFLTLPSNFSMTDAASAGTTFVEDLRALLNS